MSNSDLFRQILFEMVLSYKQCNCVKSLILKRGKGEKENSFEDFI